MLAGAVELTKSDEHSDFTIGRIKVMSKSISNFIHALVAVLAGNALYFALERYLPVRAQHVAFKIDLGTVVDFWFCLVVFGVIKTLAGRRRDSDRLKN
jgi:hypothetical protein